MASSCHCFRGGRIYKCPDCQAGFFERKSRWLSENISGLTTWTAIAYLVVLYAPFCNWRVEGFYLGVVIFLCAVEDRVTWLKKIEHERREIEKKNRIFIPKDAWEIM